jgi:hypothetical protein
LREAAGDQPGGRHRHRPADLRHEQLAERLDDSQARLAIERAGPKPARAQVSSQRDRPAEPAAGIAEAGALALLHQKEIAQEESGSGQQRPPGAASRCARTGHAQQAAVREHPFVVDTDRHEHDAAALAGWKARSI